MIFHWNYRYTMKIFSTDIPNDRNMYGDNIATKRDDYVIVPETICEINALWHDVLFYVNQKRRIPNPVSNITIKLFCSNSWLLYGSIYLMKLLGWPSRYLFVENKRCKHRNNKWNLFKVNNEDTWTASLTSLWCLYC